MWTLGEARAVIRKMQPLVEPHGFHLALGGGVLNNGYSGKDVDIYAFPLNNKEHYDPDAVVKEFEKSYGVSAEDISSYGFVMESYLFRKKFVGILGGDKRIDLFVLAMGLPGVQAPSEDQ